MVVKNVIEAIKLALEDMDKRYCTLSQIDYSKIELNGSTQGFLAEKKYLERPFAYEFYHQLRKLMDSGDVDFGGPVIQAEVDKRYQHCFTTGKIPDFITHIPNARQNLAVIEFKVAANMENIEHDFQKLKEFRKNLKYRYIIEVVIGDNRSLESAKKRIRSLSRSDSEGIVIMEFNVDSWKSNDLESQL